MLTDIKLGQVTENALYYVVNGVSTVFPQKYSLRREIHGNWAACSIVVKLLDLDLQSWWFDPWIPTISSAQLLGP